MRYLLLVCTEPIDDPAEPPPEDAIERWVERHDGTGARVWGDRLADAMDSRVVRIRAGGTSVGPGPLDPAHRAIAGIDILECASLDEAIEVAKDHPMAREGVLEVWPFWDWSQG